MCNSDIEKYGWTAVPRDVKTLLYQSETSGPAQAFPISSIKLPDSELVKSVYEYAKRELSEPTFNHSMRVYYYGQAILSHKFKSWSSPSFDETYFLSCLLHDIGTTDKNQSSTFLSFEFQGAYLALNLLKGLSASTPQAECVTETIIRHQDLGATGTVSRITALIQLATIFDNMGGNPELVSKKTIEDIVGKWPRLGWSGCFASTIRKELELKPWAHTSHIEGFAEGVGGNALMKEFE